MTTWRIVHPPNGTSSEPMDAHQLARHLLQVDESPWVESDDGVAELARDVEAVRQVIFAEHLPFVAADWLRHRAPSESGWVFDLVFDVAKHDAERGFAIVQALVAEAANDRELGLIGAGPLEDLLRRQGPRAIAQVEEAASTDSRLRSALAEVWPSEQHPDVWQRVAAAIRTQGRK